MPYRANTYAGVLIKCDASIKAMLVDIDNNSRNEFIIEDLGEEHILVKEGKVEALKQRLRDVSLTCLPSMSASLTIPDDERASQGSRSIGLGDLGGSGRLSLPHTYSGAPHRQGSQRLREQPICKESPIRKQSRSC